MERASEGEQRVQDRERAGEVRRGGAGVSLSIPFSGYDEDERTKMGLAVILLVITRSGIV